MQCKRLYNNTYIYTTENVFLPPPPFPPRSPHPLITPPLFLLLQLFDPPTFPPPLHLPPPPPLPPPPLFFALPSPFSSSSSSSSSPLLRPPLSLLLFLLLFPSSSPPPPPPPPPHLSATRHLHSRLFMKLGPTFVAYLHHRGAPGSAGGPLGLTGQTTLTQVQDNIGASAPGRSSVSSCLTRFYHNTTRQRDTPCPSPTTAAAPCLSAARGEGSGYRSGCLYSRARRAYHA